MIRTKTTHYEKVDNDYYHSQLSRYYTTHEVTACPIRKQIVRNHEHLKWNHTFYIKKRQTMEYG